MILLLWSAQENKSPKKKTKKKKQKKDLAFYSVS